MKHFICIILAMLSVALLHAQPSKGQKAPDIALPNAAGTVEKLSTHTGKVVLVDFWASWCAPCRRNHPSLVKLYSKYKDKGFEIYAVSIDEDKAAWKKAIASDKLSWTLVHESGGWDGAVATKWKIQQIPSSYLLDRTGKIVAVDLHGKQLEKKIVALLNGKI